MTIKRKTAVALLGCMILPLIATAQNAVWQLPPSTYTNISREGPDLYRASKAGKVSLIRADGTPVIPTSYSVITGFYEHCALVIKNDGGMEQVIGTLTDDGKFTRFDGTYYTLNGQAFFSEGLLTVKDEKGQLGYVNEKGSPVLGFSKDWERIKPFTEGYTSVLGKNLKWSLIDKRGKKCNIILKDVGVEVQGIRNVYQGKAYIKGDNNKWYTYDVATGNCKPFKGSADIKRVDYLNCIASVTGRGKEPPYSTLPEGKKGVSPIQENGQYGYSTGGHTILPPQFDTATPFIDGYAIVSQKGRYGILRYVEQSVNFSVSVPKSHYDYMAGSAVDCAFTLSPDSWDGKPLEVVLTDRETGEPMELTNNADRYTFRLKPHSKEQTYDISVSADGLALWSDQISYTFKKREMNYLQAKLDVASQRADENDHVAVVATITNTGNENVTATITMTGSPAFNKVSKTETIPAGGSVKVSSFFTVTQRLTNQHVSVSTNKGGHASKTGLTLLDFYQGN